MHARQAAGQCPRGVGAWVVMKRQVGDDRRWPFAEGGGVTILAATGLWVLGLALWRTWSNVFSLIVALLLTGVWLAILWFFRDPRRTISAETGVVVSPADGQVVKIVDEFEPRYLRRPVRRISIFLDVYHVHVQRVPLAGRVIDIQHQAGQFRQAFRPEASEVNEHIAMLVDGGAQGTYLVKQIAGIMARRCVNYVPPGAIVATGQRFGLIRFGSRVDLFLPVTAHVVVTMGQRVYGGVTPIAHLPAGDSYAG